MFGTREELSKFFNFNTQDNRFCCILQISHKCNIRCSCCYNKLLRDNANDNLLKPEALEKIIKYCTPKNIPMYTGVGEPFFWWDYTKNILVPMLNKYNSKYVISTNGLWGNNPKIIQEALNLNINTLFISHDWWHQQSVPTEYINNILDAFKDSSTKIYIASIYNQQHPQDEIIYKYHDQLTIHWWEFNNQVKDNIIFSHDENGNCQHIMT